MQFNRVSNGRNTHSNPLFKENGMELHDINQVTESRHFEAIPVDKKDYLPAFHFPTFLKLSFLHIFHPLSVPIGNNVI
jgi:hypothetical protein